MAASLEELTPLVSALLEVLGAHVQNGQLVLHFDASGTLQKVSFTNFVRVRKATDDEDEPASAHAAPVHVMAAGRPRLRKFK